MNMGTVSLMTRRRILQITGLSAGGMTALNTANPVQAQPAEASVTIEQQETDGNTITIQNVYTQVQAELIIVPEGKAASPNSNSFTLELDAGTEYTNAEFPLRTKITDTQRIRAEIRKNGESIARDTAIVAVNESVDEVSPTDWLEMEQNVAFIEADPEAGFHFPYFLYTPEVPDSTGRSENGFGERPLFVRLSQSSSPDRNTRIKSANKTIHGGIIRRLANQTTSPALVTPLPMGAEPTADDSFGILGREGLQITDPPYERVDLQLLAMIDDAKTRLEDTIYTNTGKIHLAGYSASGRFVDMFAALHPERINALSSGGNGVTVLPKAKLDGEIPTQGQPEMDTLPWPIGISDMPDLAGKSFDEDAWMNIDQYRFIGGEDQWDPDQHDHPREYYHSIRYKHLGEDRQQLVIDIFGWEQVDERFKTSREIYDQLDVPAEFKIYEGEDHIIEGDREDTFAFHLEKASEEFEAINTSQGTEEEGSRSGPSEATDTSASGPGFGIVAAVVGLLGAIALEQGEN